LTKIRKSLHGYRFAFYNVGAFPTSSTSISKSRQITLEVPAMSEKKIGRYEIRRELGRGGMATVYLAYDPVLEREVALKLLPNYFAHDPEFSARFEREAKTVAALEHGSIVSMYDYGEDGQWPYFVMRLMKGGSLKDRIEKGSMSLEEAAGIIERVAGALDKAHSKDIVHRDLKPGNIMFDEDGAAYLGDFGIVKLAESSESYTRTGNTLGTPAYMSPEQADGNPDIDGRSDTYSLGIILYEMLTGAAPYTHESMPRLLIMHLTAPIPNVLEARADLPASIQAVIEKAMAKNRDERYRTAGEMAAAVQAVVDGAATAVPAQPAPVVTRSAPMVEVETAVPEPEPVIPSPPKQEPTPQSTSQRTTQPAPAQRGGIPKWIYGVGAVVVLAIIGIFAFSGGPDPDVAAPETVGEVSSGETAVEPTAVAAVETRPTDEPPAVEVNQPLEEASESSRNFLADPDRWDYGFDEGSDLFFENGQAVFVTQTGSGSWANYLDVFGDGIYEVEMTMPDAEKLTTGSGMLFMYNEANLEWYEFFLDNDGYAYANYCRDDCADFEELIHAVPSPSANLGVGEVNKLTVEVANGSMIFYVNDEKIGSARNSRLAKGNIGIILFSDIEQDVKVVFDNFTYTPAP
jgi:serine/threonine-protein kinase